MGNIQITDAELELMKILWSTPEGMTSGDIRNRLNTDWERTTVLTLLSRLCEKGAVSVDREKRPGVYKPLVSREDYSLDRARSLLENLYNGSVRGLMAALCAGGDLTEQDIRELQELLDQEVT